jgi:hypothetical protein
MAKPSRSARERATRPQVPTGRAGVTSADADPDVEALESERQALPAEIARFVPRTAVSAPVDAPAPAETPVEAPAPVFKRTGAIEPHNLRAESFTVYDADALWDWCRSDADAVRAFFGHVPAYAAELHDRLSHITQAEDAKRAVLRTMWDGQVRIGFVLLFPISPATASAPSMAQAHCYLAPEARGSLPAYLGAMLNLAADHAPGVTLSVITDRPEMGRLLQSFGFTQQIVLTRPAATATTETTHGPDRR